MNKVVGLGFGGVPADAEWAAVERRCAIAALRCRSNCPTSPTPPSRLSLTERGYVLTGFENVLGRALPSAGSTVDAGVDVRVCDADDLDAWVDVVVEGFAHPDGEGVPGHEEFPRDVVERAERDFTAAGATAYLALCDGTIAGGGGMRVTDGVAQLTGAATAPAFRRRGVQAALLGARLRDAAGSGCDIAVVTTAPGSTSQKNVQRKGFQLLYSRAVLVKNPA